MKQPQEFPAAPTAPARAHEQEKAALSPEIASMAVDPSCLGSISHPAGYAFLRGDCGDSLEVFLQIRDRRVLQARFDALGCEFTVACGNAAMELAQGRSLAEALRVTPEEISTRLGGLPEAHMHCAELAAEAVRKAVEDFLRQGNDPWKKLYRTPERP